MKITNVKTFPVYHGQRNYTFVKVETDEGAIRSGRVWHHERAGRTGRY